MIPTVAAEASRIGRVHRAGGTMCFDHGLVGCNGQNMLVEMVPERR